MHGSPSVPVRHTTGSPCMKSLCLKIDFTGDHAAILVSQPSPCLNTPVKA